jgi:uncharacterized Zn-finger protein
MAYQQQSQPQPQPQGSTNQAVLPVDCETSTQYQTALPSQISTPSVADEITAAQLSSTNEPSGTANSIANTNQPMPPASPLSIECLWEGCARLKFSSFDALNEHFIRDHLGAAVEQKQPFVCRWLNCTRAARPFPRRAHLEQHFLTHTGEKKFVCQEVGCGKRFGRLDSLRIHSRVHQRKST